MQLKTVAQKLRGGTHLRFGIRLYFFSDFGTFVIIGDLQFVPLLHI